MDAAFYLASLVLCDDGGICGKCDECIKIEKWANPHLYLVSPDGDSIKKEQIEALEHEYGFASDHTRVFIIQNIDKATLTASNTLLKFLEELGENCYGVLLTENLNKVIPTIKSRCQIVNFLPISSDVVCDDLMKKGYDEERSKIISSLTNNRSLGIRYAKDKDIDKIINLVSLISAKFEEGDSGYIEFLSKGSFLNNLDRDKNRMFLDLLIRNQNDKINILINRKDNIIFKGLEFTNIMLDKEAEIKILEAILKFRERIDSNANLDIIYTQMFVEIGEVLE
jgi:DNA polymerase-3 subunit delta'